MKSGTINKLKFKRLQRQLGESLRGTVGLLETLWLGVATNCPAGDIGKYSNEEIAILADWEGDPDRLVEALLATGWLDSHTTYRLVVHDWSQHAPNYVKGNIIKSGLMFANDAPGLVPMGPSPGDSPQGIVPGDSPQGIVPPSLTKPNLTKPSEDHAAHGCANAHFDAFWKVVHKRVGKRSAERAYAKAVADIRKEHDDRDPHKYLVDQMVKFAASPQAHPKDRTAIHPTTWLNSGRYDDDEATWEESNGQPRERQQRCATTNDARAINAHLVSINDIADGVVKDEEVAQRLSGLYKRLIDAGLTTAEDLASDRIGDVAWSKMVKELSRREDVSL